MSNKLFFFTFVFLLFSSCSQKSRIELKTDVTGRENIIFFYLNETNLFFSIRYEDKKDSTLLKNFIEIAFNRFKRYGNLDSFREAPQFEYKGDLYRLYYEIGKFALSFFQNELLKCGIIEAEWRNVVKALSLQEASEYPELKKMQEEFFMIPDIDGILKSHDLKETELEAVYAYTVNFLLREVYFVSLQEILSRPERYYKMDEIRTFFYRVVVMPETLEFTKYILRKFGRGKLIEVAKQNFNKEDWRKITGEEIHETELDFTKQIEGRSFLGIYTKEGFTKELDNYLRLYNLTTKKVLFTK